MSSSDSVYTPNFYAGQSDLSLQAARAILPEVFRLVRPKSIVDVGCGTGAWLSAALELGVERAVGLEGSWVRREDLRDQRIELVTSDLEAGLPSIGAFDLAMSLEVAEHVSARRADALVAEIASLAPVVLFGAAVPGQGGGFNHVNEQWQSYWVKKFAARGYIALEAIRPKFWLDRSIQVHYRQNPFLYVRESLLEPYLAEASVAGSRFAIDVLHPEVHETRLAEAAAPLTVLQSVRAAAGLPAAVLRSLRHRLGRETGAAQ